MPSLYGIHFCVVRAKTDELDNSQKATQWCWTSPACCATQSRNLECGGHAAALAFRKKCGGMAAALQTGWYGSITAAGVIASPGTAWKPIATGDFNADSKLDIVIQNSASGDVSVWLARSERAARPMFDIAFGAPQNQFVPNPQTVSNAAR